MVVPTQFSRVTDILLEDFRPINVWTGIELGPTLDNGEPKLMLSKTDYEDRLFLNEPKDTIRYKCSWLTLCTPFVHLVAALVNIVYRIIKLVTFSHFWIPKPWYYYSFQARLEEAGADLLRIVATPIALIGLELAAIYGIFSPYNGRKIYGTIERAQYENFFLAPSFQPNGYKCLRIPPFNGMDHSNLLAFSSESNRIIN